MMMLQKTFCFMVLVFLLGFVACNGQQDIKNNVENRKKDFALSISESILEAQKKGGFYKLSAEEGTDKMVEGLTESLQKASYQHIKTIFGHYKALTLDTMVELKKDKVYKIYRFKADFEKSNNVEVRSVLDPNGKLAGFFVLPWKENL